VNIVDFPTYNCVEVNVVVWSVLFDPPEVVQCAGPQHHAQTTAVFILIVMLRSANLTKVHLGVVLWDGLLGRNVWVPDFINAVTANSALSTILCFKD